MTTRERWVVYPLLALSLGLSLRDKIMPPAEIRAERLHCRHLRVDSPQGTVALEAGALGGTEDRQVLGLVASAVVSRSVDVISPTGQKAVVLGFNPQYRNGFVSTGYTPGMRGEYMFTYGMHPLADPAAAPAQEAPPRPAQPPPTDLAPTAVPLAP